MRSDQVLLSSPLLSTSLSSLIFFSPIFLHHPSFPPTPYIPTSSPPLRLEYRHTSIPLSLCYIEARQSTGNLLSQSQQPAEVGKRRRLRRGEGREDSARLNTDSEISGGGLGKFQDGLFFLFFRLRVRKKERERERERERDCHSCIFFRV